MTSSCPKCNRNNGWDVRDYDDQFPVCVYCGYQDYTKPYKRPKYESDGVSYQVPYTGVAPAYQGKEITVRVISASLQNSKGGIGYVVACPFCTEVMKEKLRWLLKYECSNKHVIRVLDEDGSLTWK